MSERIMGMEDTHITEEEHFAGAVEQVAEQVAQPIETEAKEVAQEESAPAAVSIADQIAAAREGKTEESSSSTETSSYSYQNEDSNNDIFKIDFAQDMEY